MDTTQSMISTLQDVRANLTSATTSLESFRRKLVGARPEDSNKAIQPPTTVAGLLSEISGLSSMLLKQIAEHHEIVGSDNPKCEQGSATRAYA